MDVPFIKLEGAGNDYVYIDLMKNGCDLPFDDLAKKISDRHFGVGSDGLVLIMKGSKAPFRMRMFNSDGSEAEMCGNAIRCVAKYLFDRGYSRKEELSVETLAGVKKLQIVERDPEHGTTWVKVDMGAPILRGADIPVNVDREPVLDIEVSGQRGTAVSMGNPHFVVFVDGITDTGSAARPAYRERPSLPKPHECRIRQGHRQGQHRDEGVGKGKRRDSRLRYRRVCQCCCRSPRRSYIEERVCEASGRKPHDSVGKKE